MATEAQKEANKRNAQKSTGPRTALGKARVARNAARHWLCHTTAVMSDEKQSDFDELLNELNDEHQPEGTTEGLLVYKIALHQFHFWRASILLTERLDQNDVEDASKQVALMLRYQTTSDRAFNRNLADLRKLQKERRLQGFGSVPQSTYKEPENPPAEPAATPPAVDPHLGPTPFDPEIQSLFGISPPKKAA